MRILRKSRSSKLKALLPWYLNRTLPPAEQQRVERELQEHPELHQPLNEWRTVQTLVKGQQVQYPSPEVQARLMAQIRAHNLPRRQTLPPWLARSWGLLVTLVMLCLLWAVFQPGIQLRWQVSQGDIAGFHIYRAPAGSADFTLLTEITQPSVAGAYRFVDTTVWRGQAYTYRIVTLGRDGQQLLSSEVLVGAGAALLGQLSVTLTSVLLGWSAVLLLERWPTPPRRYQPR